MRDPDFDRVQGDLAVMRQAMGLHVAFGPPSLILGTVFGTLAAAAAGLSLLGDSDVLQVALLAAMLALGPAALCLLARRADADHAEAKTQAALSCGTYGVVWVAACGYAMAATAGPAIGAVRTSFLYATSVVLLFAFSLLLVRAAVTSRQRLYCLGLAASPLLAGLLVPIVDRRYALPVAHLAMAVGFLAGFAIQWGQLRKAVPHRAAH